MLLPAQKAAGIAATNLMQSAIDAAEQRRVDEEEKASGGKKDPGAAAQISQDQSIRKARDKIEAFLFDKSVLSINEMRIRLAERVGNAMGLERDADQSLLSFGWKLEAIFKTLDPGAIAKIEEDTGLKELGISLDTFIKALKNPYGTENDALVQQFETRAGTTAEGYAVQSRTLQRLESITSRKTAEELRLEATGYDPTRINDDEMRQERAEDVRKLDAMAKLDDVRELQDAVKESHDQQTGGGVGGGEEPGKQVSVDVQLLQIMAAGADAAKAELAEVDGGSDASGADAADGAMPGAANGASVSDPEMISEIAGERAISSLAVGAEGQALEGAKAILAVQIDEIGIYELLKRRMAA